MWVICAACLRSILLPWQPWGKTVSGEVCRRCSKSKPLPCNQRKNTKNSCHVKIKADKMSCNGLAVLNPQCMDLFMLSGQNLNNVKREKLLKNWTEKTGHSSCLPLLIDTPLWTVTFELPTLNSLTHFLKPWHGLHDLIISNGTNCTYD